MKILKEESSYPGFAKISINKSKFQPTTEQFTKVRELMYELEDVLDKTGNISVRDMSCNVLSDTTASMYFTFPGDWKHEHWYADTLITKFFQDKNLEIIDLNNIVTEDDGSDYYTAKHTIQFKYN